MGLAAASSKETVSGFDASADTGAIAYIREGAAAGAEHRVARCELCDARPDSFDHSGNVDSGLPELAPPR